MLASLSSLYKLSHKLGRQLFELTLPGLILRKRFPILKQVFLSSVCKNLTRHRDGAYSAIQHLDGYHCIRMEDFGARDYESEQFCRERVAECDIFIALVGPDYGSCPMGSAKSYTQMEYETAIETGKRLLAFCTYDDLLIPADQAETDASRSRQRQFRERAKSERQAAFFRTPDELAALIMAALSNLPAESSTSTVLLFPYLSNIGGFDTGIAICNISGPPLDATAIVGTCTFHFYGAYSYGDDADEHRAESTTVLIPPGATHTNLVSSLRPGSQGHVIAVCQFPARGFALLTDGFGGPGRGLSGSYLAEVIQGPPLKSPFK